VVLRLLVAFKDKKKSIQMDVSITVRMEAQVIAKLTRFSSLFQRGGSKLAVAWQGVICDQCQIAILIGGHIRIFGAGISLVISTVDEFCGLHRHKVL